MKHNPLFLVVVLCILSTTSLAEWHYYYFDQKQLLTLDTAWVAVFSQSEDFLNQNSSSSGSLLNSLDSNNVEHLSVAGWYLLPTSSTSKTDSGIQTMVRALIADTSVEFSSPVFIGLDGGPVIVTPHILMRFHDGITAEQAERILQNENVGTIIDRNWGNMNGAYRIQSKATNGIDVLAAANKLAEREEVKFAEPDMVFSGRTTLFPNDPGFPYCWGLHNTGQFGPRPDVDMDAPEAWDITTGDPSIIVVIIDTGVEQTHPDINQVPGTDTTSDISNGGGPVNVCDNHGTAVAGCVSATMNNSLGTVGIAPGCKSASARTFISTLNCSGNWTAQGSWTVNTLAWAESIGARVTNNSNFYGFTSSAIANKYSDTRNAGMVHFASAGNNNSDVITYPSSLPSVNAIAALQMDGELASFSNNGPGLAFSAPGLSIYTTDRTGSAGWVSGDYVFASGTSFASPYSAGVAALYLSLFPSATAFEVETALYASCDDFGDSGYDLEFGWGSVNAVKALTWEATCGTVESNLAEPVIVDKSRYLALRPGNTGLEMALRVVFSNLVGFESFNGQYQWVGPPELFQDGAAPEPVFYASALQCTPHYRVWDDIDLLHVYGTAIVPDSMYETQVIAKGCNTNTSLNYSTSLEIKTGKWGDIIPPYATPELPQPNIDDVLGLVGKWLGQVNPSKVLGQLQPSLPNPNQDISIDDVLIDVGAWLSSPYPFEGPSHCP